jgi:hypothetical protein
MAYIRLILVALLLCMMTAGCLSPWGRKPSLETENPVLQLTGRETLTKVVFQTNWLATVSMIGICLGVAAFVNGQKLAIPIIVACGVGLFLSLAVARYAAILAFGGLVLAVGIVVYAVFSKNKAIRQLVATVDVARENLPEDADKKLFGDENCVIKGAIQSGTTTRIVKRVKNGGLKNLFGVKQERVDSGSDI